MSTTGRTASQTQPLRLWGLNKELQHSCDDSTDVCLSQKHCGDNMSLQHCCSALAALPGVRQDEQRQVCARVLTPVMTSELTHVQARHVPRPRQHMKGSIVPH